MTTATLPKLSVLPNDATVLITQVGTVHRKDWLCPESSGTVLPVTVAQAVAYGRTACRLCWGDASMFRGGGR